MSAIEKINFRNKDGYIDYDRIIELMDIAKNEFADMLDYNRTSLKSNKKPTPKMLATMSPFFRILAILWDHFEGDQKKISTWLHEPNKSWLYLSPIEMMKCKKTDKVIELLTAHLDTGADLFYG